MRASDNDTSGPGEPHEDQDGPVTEPRLGGSSFDATLDRWAAEARVDEAARARSRQRSLRRQATESTTFTAVLADLYERGRPLTVGTSAGTRHRGTILTIGSDFVAIETSHRSLVLLALNALATLRPEPRSEHVASGRRVQLELELASALAELAHDRPRVSVCAASAEATVGELVAVGIDVVTIRSEGHGHALAYVRIPSITEVVVPAR